MPKIPALLAGIDHYLLTTVPAPRTCTTRSCPPGGRQHARDPEGVTAYA